MKTLVIIPSRLSASRLPGKPLLKINGLSIISHVYKKAQKANIGEVFVAAEDKEIVEDVKKNGGDAILTNNNHKTGTDRIYEAFVKLGRTDIDLIMNLQGDEPLMNIEDIQKLNKHMIQTKRDLGTLAAKINDKKVFENHDIVKVITEESLDETGNNVAMSAFTDFIGFMVLALSIMPLFVTFGLIMAVMIFLSFVAAVIMLPALLYQFGNLESSNN